jgi:MscS family membrane protein
MAVILMLEYVADDQINLSGNVNKITLTTLRGLFVLAAGWNILLIGDRLTEALASSAVFQPKGIDITVIRLIIRTITILFIVLLLWNASDYLGLSLTAVFASAGIAGLAVALAARETMANFFGGISILLDRPFKLGDYIVLDTGERGQVMEVGMRSTKIITRDDIQISIPNSLITSTKVVNESAPKPHFRVRIKVGVAYDTDVARVGELLLQLAHENVMVLVDPKPQVRFLQFGDSALEMELRCWARRPEDRGLLVHQLNSAIEQAFQEHQITIPFPQRDVHMVSK